MLLPPWRYHTNLAYTYQWQDDQGAAWMTDDSTQPSGAFNSTTYKLTTSQITDVNDIDPNAKLSSPSLTAPTPQSISKLMIRSPGGREQQSLLRTTYRKMFEDDNGVSPRFTDQTFDVLALMTRHTLRGKNY